MDVTTIKPTGLDLLREPFPEHQISYLPKGGVKLAYVGHAALTDRLLDADPAWTWEPLAMSDHGLPVMDDMGGMWIKLTVCSVTRLGYGHAGTKTGGDAIKEVIGDALRNAAMRFGAALDLWHKGGELHKDEDDAPKPKAKPKPDPKPRGAVNDARDPAAFNAARTAAEVAKGVLDCDVAGAAFYLSTLAQPKLDAVWVLLTPESQDKLTAAWPKETPA